MPDTDAPNSDSARRHEMQSAAPDTMTKTIAPATDTPTDQSADALRRRPDIEGRNSRIACPPDACSGARIDRKGIESPLPPFGHRVPEMADKAMESHEND